MNKKIIAILVCLASLPVLTEARGFGGIGHMPSMYSTPRYRSYSSVHTVRSYTTSEGKYYQQHLSGNPRSGVHCSNNLCV